VSPGELVALARRHIAAVVVVSVVAVGVAYSFKHTPPTWEENATIVLAPPNLVLAPPYANPYAPPFGSSLIITGEVMMKWMAGPQGQQMLSRAGIANSFSVSLINFSDLEYPLYSSPNLTISATGASPVAVHSALAAGTQIFEQGLTSREARANVPPDEQIAMHVIGDSGPGLALGSSKRTYAGLAVLTVIAMYMILNFIDCRPSLLRRFRRSRFSES
jgi:hypothetical protein